MEDMMRIDLLLGRKSSFNVSIDYGYVEGTTRATGKSLPNSSNFNN